MDVDFPVFSSSDEEENDTTKPNTSAIPAVLPRGGDHILAVIERKISLISEHPLTEITANIMEQHKGAILEVACSATRLNFDDIDAEWIRNRFASILFAPGQRERLLEICERYLLELAQYGSIHGQAQYKSDCLRAKKLRQLRVDELERFSERHGEAWDNINRKRLHQEEVEEADDEEPDRDRYMRRTSFGKSIFAARSPSPVQAPAESIDEPELACSTATPDQAEFEAEISSLVPTEEENRIIEPSRRQQLRDQLSSHICFVKPLGNKTGSTDQRLIENDIIDKRNAAAVKKQRNKRTPNKSLPKKNNTVVSNHRILRLEHREQREEEIIEENRENSADYEPVVISSTSSDSIEITKENVIFTKSCIKRIKQVNSKRSQIRVQFADGVNFAKRSDPLIYDATVTRFGQTRTDIILSYERESSAKTKGAGTETTYLPNCDKPITLAIRKDPNISKKNKIAELKSDITKELNNVIRRSHSYMNGLIISRLLITDSMLSSLNIKIFKNMDLLCLNFPRMPGWFIESLDDWFAKETAQYEEGVLTYTKIFISLGLDLIFYYADPAGKEIDHLIVFLRQISEWFERKLKEIKRKSQKERKEQGKEHTSMELKRVRERIDRQGQPYTEIVWRYKITMMPTFVVITIPEIGGWKRFLGELNRRLRTFVREEANSQYFELLDWAQLVKNEEPALVDTVEKRGRLLVNELFAEHGVLYE